MNAGGQERRVIDGRFELLGRLGAGGMGMVWRARDLALHREVALKEVRPPDPALLAADPAAARTLRERVLREARALARIDHPGVVTIHHIVDAAEIPHPWIVMELVQGQSLQERLAQGLLTPGEAAAIGRGVLAALRAAHAAGIHHRDVKPANVLLRPDGRPVLTDFGIAALQGTTGLTATGELIGSPEYIAPERIRGDEGRTASDLWSLGMLLYVSVEGTHPLRRTTPLATLAAVLDEQIPQPVRSGPLGPVVMALLDRNPDARPGAAELDRLLAAIPEKPGFGPAAPDTVPAPLPPTVVTPAPAVLGQRPAPPPPAFRSPTAPFSAPASPAPRGPAPLTTTPTRPGRARGNPVVPIAAAVVGVGLTGVLVWTLLPGNVTTEDNSSGPDRTVSGAPVDPGAQTSDPAAPYQRSAKSLLTPSAAREVIQKLKPVMGGTEVTNFKLYGEYASADAPVAGNKELYDTYDYRGGRTTKRAGGTLSADDGTVDLTSINWDALPALLSRADKDLGVDKPTYTYVIVEGAWTFADGEPTLLVYVADDYGGAFLAADISGKVLETHPRKGN
ncbi:protein kinase [Streptomyces sp. NPDC056244]|uniref:protein kinase domain-containing protein n=1 Tax=Streptomyces sp. NPDC056244 TaxID=3345762 RepID=UPI0035DCC3A9